MTVMEDKIVSTILNDKELLDYVEKLVAKRLPAGPYLKADLAWYKQVVDLTINQAFEDLQVVETLNYQISQLGKYLKTKSEDEGNNSRDDGDTETDSHNREDRTINYPSFSPSEPVQRSRRPRKESLKKLTNQRSTGNDQTDRILQKQAIKLQQQQIDRQRRHNIIQEDDEVQLMITNTKLQNALNLANRCITDEELSLYHSRNNEVNNSDDSDRNIRRNLNGNGNGRIEAFDYIAEPIRPSMSFSNQLNNLQQNIIQNKRIDHDNSFEKSGGIILKVDNTNDIQKNKSTAGGRSNISRYSNMQTSSGTESVDSYSADLPVHLDEIIQSRANSNSNT